MRGLKEYVFGVHFDGLFIFNLHIFMATEYQAYMEALKQLEIRYPMKHKECELTSPYELPIAEYEEPKGIVIKMIA